MGAVIGYVTNKIAILMLFRPLEKKRLFGMPLPLTPGIIPRQRGDLARSIGRMVSRELITEEALQTHVLSPQFNASIQRTFLKFMNSVLDAKLSGLFRSPQDLPSREKSPLFDMIRDVLNQKSFTRDLARFLHILIQSVDVQIPLYRISGFIEGVLKEPDKTAEMLKTLLSKAADRGLPASSVISDEVLDSLEKLIDRELPFVGGKVVEFLNKPEMKQEMEKRGVLFLRTVFDKFSGIQRFFITAGQYDITLEENMDEIITDLISHIQSVFADTRRTAEMARTIRTAIQEKRDSSLDKLLTASRIETLSRWLVTWLGTIPFTELQTALKVRDTRIRSQTLTRYIEAAHIEAFLVRIIQLLNTEETGSGEVEVVFASGSFRHAIHDMKVKDILPVPGRSLELIAAYASAQISTLVTAKSKEIIEALDIYSLVVTKIDSLDIASVERLLLQVIEKHLKWINLFGAVLGALIGGIQILLSMAGL
ncbi:MAG: DUF445 family protein [Spirochaetales bacterium]|nr:DUF445 family protein [Spirochaetales bacterium]